ncbi:hypothetical protein GPALN_009726 [Globodera pallida]|nr:hypothetical protein GPALN_009726 [Globodera pallida]
MDVPHAPNKRAKQADVTEFIEALSPATTGIDRPSASAGMTNQVERSILFQKQEVGVTTEKSESRSLADLARMSFWKDTAPMSVNDDANRNPAGQHQTVMSQVLQCPLELQVGAMKMTKLEKEHWAKFWNWLQDSCSAQ